MVVGGGFKRDLSARSGFRGDVRLLIGGNKMRVLVDAEPAREIGALSFSSLLNATNPGLVFSNNTAVRTSLSGSPISGFETFSGSGTGVQSIVFTVGYFRRF
jgi:hypothetical protein